MMQFKMLVLSGVGAHEQVTHKLTWVTEFTLESDPVESHQERSLPTAPV